MLSSALFHDWQVMREDVVFFLFVFLDELLLLAAAVTHIFC
jgi:hypothetical protein